MRPLPNFLLGAVIICGFLGMKPEVKAQQSLPGNYTMQSGDVTLTLKLTQQGNSLAGTLSGSTGASFTISGQVENNIGYGTCAGSEGSVFFEAYADGDELTLSLVEPDQYGAPDYNQVQSLQFSKKKSGEAGTTTGAVTGALGLGATGSAAQGTGNNQQRVTGTTGTAAVGDNEVGDPAWGIKFGLPQDWVKQQNMEGAIVGHNTIAGMVMVIPHMATNLQEMQTEMQKGLQEEGSYLVISGGLQQISQNVLAGDYAGVADGTQVKANGFGILSPSGGGAYLIAVSTPDMLGPELIGAAESMVKSVQYFKVDAGDLVQHFAGNWVNHTSNTSTWVCFCPDGTYSEQYEAAYSGDYGAGANQGSFSMASQDSDRGRWTVRGNKDSGTIIVKLANGNEINYQYQVHVEDGHKYYTEYYLNGYLYGKK